MYSHRLAYRWEDNSVEGFAAVAFESSTKAKEKAIELIRRKCMEIGQAYTDTRLITDKKQVTTAELKTIQTDWRATRLTGLK